MQSAKKNSKSMFFRTSLSFGISLAVAVLGCCLAFLKPGHLSTAQGWTVAGMTALVAGIWSASSFLSLLTLAFFRHRRKPEAEAMMIGRLYRLISVIVIVLAVAHCFGTLGRVGTLFSLFGGMLMGWSLQAPVSGFAAWVLINIKRPFRPGDRIQFPSLGLVGDVKEIGAMYVNLDQVGGSVGSEEATGRHILIPNAMLFSQVIINFTVKQQQPYMLDEVILRITYDSNVEAAERILLEAAREVTHDIIKATGVEPYIRSDLYDYGVYLRLRFQTRVKDRAEIAYKLNTYILKAMQRSPEVDLAIPYVYSYQAGRDRKEDAMPPERGDQKLEDIELSRIHSEATDFDPRDVDQLAHSIAVTGLLQPIILQKKADGQSYTIVAGGLRFEACKKLGWKTIPAIIRNPDGAAAARQGCVSSSRDGK